MSEVDRAGEDQKPKPPEPQTVDMPTFGASGSTESIAPAGPYDKLLHDLSTIGGDPTLQDKAAKAIETLVDQNNCCRRVLAAAGFNMEAQNEGEYMNEIECGLPPKATRIIAADTKAIDALQKENASLREADVRNKRAIVLKEFGDDVLKLTINIAPQVIWDFKDQFGIDTIDLVTQGISQQVKDELRLWMDKRVKDGK